MATNYSTYQQQETNKSPLMRIAQQTAQTPFFQSSYPEKREPDPTDPWPPDDPEPPGPPPPPPDNPPPPPPAPSTLPGVLPGWDITKWQNASHTTPKYVVGRILAQYPATPEGLKQALPQIQAQFPGTTLVGADKLNIPNVGTIDVGAGFNSGDPSGMQWWWGDLSQQGATTAGSPPPTQTYNFSLPNATQTISAQSVMSPQTLPKFQPNPAVSDLNSLAASLIQQAAGMAPLNRDPLKEQQKELLLSLREQQLAANELDATRRGIEGGVPSSRSNDIYDAFNRSLSNAYRGIDIAAEQGDLTNLLNVAGAAGGLGGGIFGQDLASQQQALAELLGIGGLNQQESQFSRNYALQQAQAELNAQIAYWNYILGLATNPG